jgi:hypothetical protein
LTNGATGFILEGKVRRMSTQAMEHDTRSKQTRNDPNLEWQKTLMASGTAYADKGEASAPEVRKLWWDLSPEQRDLANQIMTKEVEAMKSLPADQIERQIAAVGILLTAFDQRKAEGDDEDPSRQNGG